jgi:PKD repeat protein
VYVTWGAELQLTDNPAHNYEFTYWTASGGVYFVGWDWQTNDQNNPVIIYVTSAGSVTAYYQYATHVTFGISAPWYLDIPYTLTFNGKNYSGTVTWGFSTKTFSVPPGAYSWKIKPVKVSGTYAWWSYTLIATPSSGFATTNATIHINYVSPNDVYNFTWYESGLPNGTKWGVMVDGNTLFTTGTSITETFVKGTKNSWNVIMPSGYDAVPYTGLFTNAGSVNISFIQPHVSISASPSSGEVPLTVTFTANATGGSGNYEYDFFYEANNGSEESTGWQTSNTFTYKYITNGIFETGVEVFDKNYGIALGYASTQVEVTAPPLNVSLEAVPTAGLPPLNVTFVSHISGGTGQYNYTLYFGNGQTSNLANVTYTYSKVGTYYAILEVTSGTLTANSNSIPITVYQPLPITANLSASTTVVPIYSSVNFTVTAKGGSGLYYFTFYVNYAPVLSTSKPAPSWNFSYTFDTAGKSVVYVEVTDAILGSSYSAQTNTIVIYVLYT